MFRGLVALALGLLLLPIWSASAQDRWVLLASRDIELSAGETAIDLDAAKPVKHLRLVAKTGSITLSKVVVSYRGGQTHTEARRINLLAGERTKPIDPREEARFADRLALVFDAGPKAGAITRLEVWGLASEQRPPAVAQKGEVDSLNRQVEQLYRDRKYGVALPLAERSAEGAKLRFGEEDTHYATALSWLVKLYLEERKVTEAEPLARHVLAIREKKLSAEHPDTASSLIELAEVLSYQNRQAEAAPLEQRAIEIREKSLGPKHPDTAQALGSLAGSYQVLGRFADAEALFKRSLAIREEVLGPDHADVAISFNDLAGLYRAQGRYADAEPLYKRSLGIREKALGPDHADVATALNNLAGLYRAQGRYPEAEPLYKRALAIREQGLGPDHPDVATALNNLAVLYEAQGRYGEAEPLYQRSLAIWEKALGPDHPNVATSLNNLAALYKAQRKYELAEPLYQRSLAITKKALGPEHPEVAKLLNRLALVFMAQDRHAEAEPLLKRALTIAEKSSGPEHLDMADYLTSLAGLHEEQGRYAEAEPLFRRALSINEKALGPDHPDNANIISSLGALYREQGRYADAEPLLRRAVSITEKAYGPDHSEVANALVNLGALQMEQGRCAEGEPDARRVIQMREKAFGPDDRSVATALNNLAFVLKCTGRYTEADVLYERALAIYEKVLGPEHRDVGSTLNNLASSKVDQGSYAEAVALAERAHAIYSKALGPDHPDLSGVLNTLASGQEALGHVSEAQAILMQSLAILERAFGPEHPTIATVHGSLGWMYRQQGRYADAERSFKTAIAIAERTLGLDHPEVGKILNNLGILYDDQARYDEAEPLLRRALNITERTFGSDHPNVGARLNNLGENLREQRRYADAEPLLARALSINEKTFGPDHPDVAVALNNLALLYARQSRGKEAEDAYMRSLAINEASFGAGSSEVARSLGNLAGLYVGQNRYAEAEPLVRRALAIERENWGPNHPEFAQALSVVSELNFSQSKWSEAAGDLREATDIMIRRSARGAETTGELMTGKAKSDAARRKAWLLGLVKTEHRLREAQPEQAAALAASTFVTAQWAQSSEAAGALAQMAARAATGAGGLAGLVRERQDLAAEWQVEDKRLSVERSKPSEQRDALADRQRLQRLAAIDARVAEIDQRLAKDFPDYAALAAAKPASIAGVQAQLSDNEALVLMLEAPSIEPTPEESFIWVATKTDMRWVRSEFGEDALRLRVAALRCGLDRDGEWQWSSEKNRRLARNPVCAALRPDGLARNEPPPFDLARAHELYKALFGQIEDLIKGKHLLIVASGALTSLPMHVLITALPKGPPSGDRSRDVALLGAQMQDVPDDARRSLGLQGSQGTTITNITPGGPAEAAGLKPNDILLSVGGKDVAGYRHTIDVIRTHTPRTIVQVRLQRDGEEQEVPVTLGETTIHEWMPRLLDAEAAQEISWLTRSHAITVLPSVASLAALRRHAEGTSAPEAFVGFGNPLLLGRGGTDRSAWAKQSCPKEAPAPEPVDVAGWGLPEAFTSLFRGGVADVAALRLQAPLPETADELCAVARGLGADENAVNLGARATETRVRQLSGDGTLARARVVHFATHGLIASETEIIAKSRAEPALLLSPPDSGSATDDGLLTASEITELKLNADWVVLSACNTAAGGQKGDAEALSGLARAFFYAGAHALLVSHWYVDSEAAVKITTGAFSELKKNPAIGRAEALRLAMLAAMTDTTRPKSWTPAAHPAVWAPFVVVGEGGAGR